VTSPGPTARTTARTHRPDPEQFASGFSPSPRRVGDTPGGVILLLETIVLLDLPQPDRGAALRRRHLALILQALRAPAEGTLPGPPPGDDVLSARWRVRGPLDGPADRSGPAPTLR